MKQFESLDRSDKRIVGSVVFLALLLLSWLVYDVAFLNPMIQGQKPIGRIYQSNNNVKRKFNSSLIWYNASPDEVVYENDWIFTGSQSIAKIKLDSGGEIVVEPDSLIVLSRKNGVLQLNLQHGRLLAKADAGEVDIKVSRNGELEDVSWKNGAIVVEQEEVVQADQGEIDFSTLDVDADGTEDLTLGELADFRNFSPPKGFSEIDSNGLSFMKQETFNFKLYSGEKAIAELDWIDPFAKYQSFEIQIASDQEFKSPILQRSVSVTPFFFENEESRDTYWRVRGLDAQNGASAWGATRKAKIVIEWLEKDTPVQLTKNQFEHQIDNNEVKKLKADRSYSLDRQGIDVKWSPNKKASAYRLQVSDTEDFSNILQEEIVKDTHYTFKQLQLGETHFQVIPENENGTVIAKPARGKVASYLPAPASPKVEEQEQDLLLSWDALPHTNTYKVSYRDSQDGPEKEEYTEGNKLTLPKTSNFLQWSVQAVDDKKRTPLSPQSKKVDWYDQAKKLASISGPLGQSSGVVPQITHPAPRKTFISVNGSDLFFLMKWNYSEPALGYVVEIARKPDMSQTIFKEKIADKKQLVIHKNFKPGIYFMRVRALKEDVTEESWSEAEVFRVLDRKY